MKFIDKGKDQCRILQKTHWLHIYFQMFADVSGKDLDISTNFRSSHTALHTCLAPHQMSNVYHANKLCAFFNGLKPLDL